MNIINFVYRKQILCAQCVDTFCSNLNLHTHNLHTHLLSISKFYIAGVAMLHVTFQHAYSKSWDS